MQNDNEITMGGQKPSGNTNHDLNKIANAINNPDATPDMLKTMIDNEFPIITDVVDLPSKGVFYANKQSQVKIKHMTSESDNILTSANLIKSGKVLDVLLDNAIVDKTLTSEEMLTGDRNAVLLFLRKEGYGDVYEVKMTCPECNEEFKDEVLISSLKHKEVTIHPDSDMQFTLTLPKTKWIIRFRLLTGKDEDYVSKRAEMKKKSNKGYSELLTEKFIHQVTSVNGKTDKLVDIERAIKNMPIGDSLFLREYMRDVEPGVNMEHSFICKHCGEIFEDTVPVTAKLFWPNAKI